MIDQLSKRELMQLLDLQDACLHASNEICELDRLITQLKDLIPFDAALISFNIGREGSRDGQLLNFKFDERWLTQYQRGEYHKQDPVVFMAATSQHAFSYDQASLCSPHSSSWFRDQARGYGYEDGICYAQKQNEETFPTLLNLTSFFAETIESHHLTILERIAPHITCVLTRKGTIYDRMRKAPRLTKTETEVLQWCKDGKTAWEIGQILSKSERAIKFHLSNIYQKLHVSSRAQAVAQAMAYGIIELG